MKSGSMINLLTYHEDGSATSCSWQADEAVVEALHNVLGEPQSSFLVPDAEAAIRDVMPSFDRHLIGD